MRRVLISPFIPVAWRVDSHRAAQAAVYAGMLEDAGTPVEVSFSNEITDFSVYDEAYVYHGNDMHDRPSAQANIFGGVSKFPYAYNMFNFYNTFRGKPFSLGRSSPDYYTYIRKKVKSAQERGIEILPEFLNLDYDNLKRITETSETIIHPFVSKKLVVGDSHTISMYRPGWMVKSVPYKTLFGVLKNGIDELIKTCGTEFDELELYFGNIDIRHHLMRQPNPEEACRVLARRYVDEAVRLSLKYKANVSIYELLPIETEDRDVPSTGLYEGTPFFGSREARDNLRLAFRDELNSHGATRGIKIIHWVEPLLDERGWLDTNKMEHPRSVHLSRAAYPYWTGQISKKQQKKNSAIVVAEPTNTLEEFFV